MIFFVASHSVSVRGKELTPMMAFKAKPCEPAKSPKFGGPELLGQATDSQLLADQPESPSIEFDDQVYIQRMAAETDLGGEPESADSADK